ncbi:MAG: serine endopeptidase, partial [Burkholderiales bacterium]|nr:serine endopeptidase [Burkholderiales bacterium]
MFKFLRVPERLFAFVMWGVSFVFAGFLVGLGDKVVADLPHIQAAVGIEQFADPAALQHWRDVLATERSKQVQIDERLARARLDATAAGNAYRSGYTAFQNWIAARTATTDPRQDPEVIRRTHDLDASQAAVRETQAKVEGTERESLLAHQAVAEAERAQAQLLANAQMAYDGALHRQELRVFASRLALTLPLLLVGGWMVAKKRRSDYWPLMRGFVLFAVFAFFVELVP